MDGVRKAVRQDMFVLEMDDGETWTIPGTNSTIRRLSQHLTSTEGSPSWNAADRMSVQ